MRTLRIGVVGFGAMGRHHARNLNARDDITFAGVVDMSPDARAAAAGLGYRTYATIDALIASGLDAVVISVPTSEHEAVAEVFADRSIAILLEKPIAQNLEAARRVIARCAQRGVPLMIGYIERYNPAIEAVRAFVTEGNLGRLISMNARRVGVFPPRIKDANVIVDISVHDIDIVAFITNARLELISAQGGMAVLSDRLDYASLMLSAAGCAVSIETNWITPVKIRELSITGTNGFCHVDYITQDARFAPGRSFEPSVTYERLVQQHTEGMMLSLPVNKREPLAREIEVFINGVRGGPLPDPRLAIASLRIAEEATELIHRSVKPNLAVTA
jgi:UDP-N-acetylglucosamine 3-dehydrogenase